MRLIATLMILLTSAFSFNGVLFAADAKGHAVAAKALTDGVEVRQAPDDKSPSIATLKKGENVTASDRKGAYWKVRLSDGKEGFVPVTSLQTKAGINEAKGAIEAAKAKADAPAPAAAAPSPSPTEQAKAAINAKVDEAKAKQDADAKKEPDTKAQKLEKAANNLFKKK